MGELYLSRLSQSAARFIQTVRRSLAAALVGALVLTATFALVRAGAGAQVPDKCFVDRAVIDAFVAKVPDAANRFKCTNGKATELVLDGVDFGGVPSEIGALSNLVRLSLFDSFLTELPPEIGNLTELTYLNFYENQITELPPEIGKLTKLTFLDASDNPLTALPTEVANLTNLTELNLSNGGFSAVPPEVTTLTKLKTLDLSENVITALPPEIGNLTELRTLRVSGNELGVLPAEIGNLTKLKVLDARDANLTRLPTEIAKLRRLERLHVDDNDLGSLPPQVWGLKNLTSLGVSGNGLTSVSREIGNLTYLTNLDLGDNALTILPAEIGNLTQLISLDLFSNALVSLPAEVGNLAKLDRIYIARNKLTALPPTIGSLDRLTWLLASNNELASVPREIGDLDKVRFIDLGYNKLTTLPPEIGNLQNLSSLTIAQNELVSLPVEIGELTKRPDRFYFGANSQYQDSGLTFPYVAISSCASGSPSLIAMPPQDPGALDTATIAVNGTSYPLVQNPSRLSTLTLIGAGTGPTFSVNFAGQTQIVTCQDSSAASGDPGLAREVSIARSCLAGNGRVDFNIVNSESDALYRIEFPGLDPRERTVAGTEAWRMPFTGRADGIYTVKVIKTLLADDTTEAITRDFAIDCDAKSPRELSQEVEVITYCVAGNGFIRYQFVNPTPAARVYIMHVEGEPRNRSTTAQAFSASTGGVPGQVDGTYSTTVEYGDRRGKPIHTQEVTIDCANP